jgi:ABC-type spermidine/putrescine transport system permease subunit II
LSKGQLSLLLGKMASFNCVFILFFIVPLLSILMVSFWDFNEYEILPDLTFKNYLSIFDGCLNTQEMCVTLKTDIYPPLNFASRSGCQRF